MIKLIAAVSLAGSLMQAFEYTISDPVGFPMRVAVQDVSIPGSSVNPSLLPCVDYSYLLFSVSRPYGLDELISTGLRAGTQLGRFSIQSFWSEFGMEEYREDSFEIKAGVSLCETVSYGCVFDYRRAAFDIDGFHDSYSIYDCGMSISFFPLNSIYFSFEAANCFSLWNKNNVETAPFDMRFGTAFVPFSGLSIIYNINRYGDELINTFQLSAKILSSFAIIFGYSPELNTSSVSVTFLCKRISVSGGFRYHSFLGYTASLSCCLTSEPLSFIEFQYGGKKQEETIPDEKIDINTCSEDEIRSVVGLNELYASRIIRFRKIIGPISIRNLYQIGMSSKEVYSLFDYTYGYAEEDKNRKKWKAGWEKRESAKRSLFRNLVSAGLSASSALEVSDLAGYASFKHVIFYIESIKEIDREKKNRAKQVCRKYMR